MGNRNRSAAVTVLAPTLVLFGLVVLFFNKMALTNLILARGDTFLYFYPYWNAAAGALREARIPLWNPAIFMGVPMLANSQVGFFYPLNWPIWWLFETPYAVSASILLHIFIAAAGTYLVGRHVLSLTRSAALVSAASFALGGYLTAQVEHVNQLQGLAWLPWFLVALNLTKKGTRRSWGLATLIIGCLFAMQLLAGHTQTAFITGVGLLIWIIADWLGRRYLSYSETANTVHTQRVKFSPITALAAGGVLALLLAAVQLFPTLELTRYSSRQGGLLLNEVLSFSLPPHTLTRSLLPAYGQSLFSEYVAFVPLIVIALAFIGGWQWKRREGVLPALALAVSGLLLALGAYNPLYWLLARLPGFNLFRAPARWLVLYALGLSLLAGLGWHLLWQWAGDDETAADRRVFFRKKIVPPLILFLLIVFLLTIWGFAAGYFVSFIPAGPEAPLEAPSAETVIGWLLEVAAIVVLSAAIFLVDDGRWRRVLLVALLLVGLIAGFLASRSLPYNNLTTPEAFFDLRPSTARLMASDGDLPQRMLSLSDIFFDPGDQAEIDSIYGDQLSDQALYDYTIAIKQKEINAPNLPMVYKLASVDGFDGGVLPLRAYSQLMSVLLADGQQTSDGRLREHLDAVPEAHWLDLFNARYLITDKTGDIWIDGVYYDRQHPISIDAESTVSVGAIPEYEAAELRLLVSAQPGTVHIVTRDGDSWTLEAEAVDEDVYRVIFPQPATVDEISIDACPQTSACTLEGIALVDSRDGTFQALVPGEYRLIHSGDVKIYENSDVMPRVFMVNDWQIVSDTEESIAAMLDPGFDVRSTAVIERDQTQREIAVAGGLGDPGQAGIVGYHPEQVVVRTDTPGGGLLVLTDVFYPGWIATIDGDPTPIYRANALFRGVLIPEGQHEVVFQFESTAYRSGLIVFILTLGIILIGLIWLTVYSRRNL